MRFVRKKMNAHAQAKANMAVIDKQLDALVEITGQTKMSAYQINSELKDQNKMIEGTSQKMEHVDGRVVRATSKVNEVAKS